MFIVNSDPLHNTNRYDFWFLIIYYKSKKETLTKLINALQVFFIVSSNEPMLTIQLTMLNQRLL